MSDEVQSEAVQGLAPRTVEVAEVQGLEPKAAPAVDAVLVEDGDDSAAPAQP